MDLSYYLDVLGRRKWTLVLSVVIVTAAAVFFSLVLGPTYTGTATVLVSERDLASATLGSGLPELSSQPERNLQTHIELVQLRPLLEEAISESELDIEAKDLAERVTVSPVGQTNLLTIEVEDEDATQAALIANAVAAAYVDWSRELRRERIQAAALEVESQLAVAEAELTRIRAEGQPEDEAGAAAYQAELAVAADRYAGLAGTLDELRISAQLQDASGSVVASATVEAEPSSPQPVRVVGIGMAVGLLVGLGLAFVTESLDDKRAGTTSERDAS